MNINKHFTDNLYIITNNNKEFHIEKKNIYINDSSLFTGYANIIKNGNNLTILREVFPFDGNRIRYFCDEYINVKMFSTIEINESGEEVQIAVIEDYDSKTTKIKSIGNIKKIISDSKQRKPKSLKLFKSKEDNSLVA